MGCEVIVMLYLRCVLDSCQAKILFYKFICQFYPIYFWKCRVVRVEIPGGTSELCSKRDINQLFDLILYSLCKYHYFLTQSRRGCWLAVGMCQHRNIFPFLCK